MLLACLSLEMWRPLACCEGRIRNEGAEAGIGGQASAVAARAVTALGSPMDSAPRAPTASNLMLEHP